MLIWLDSTINKKAKPNENYAREVMELFSLGRGHYTEKDVQEAARAFTGWFVIRDEFSVVPRQHDDGPKTVLGRKGNWSGDDIPAILLDQPACAEWICRKLFRYFVSESHSPSEALLAPLARAFRESGYQIQVPVAMILRSNLFFDAVGAAAAGQVPGRVRGRDDPGAGGPQADGRSRPRWREACVQMGQSLYAPPSVAGWDWGPGLDQLDHAAGPGQPGPARCSPMTTRPSAAAATRPAGRPPRLPPARGGRPVPARPAGPRAARAGSAATRSSRPRLAKAADGDAALRDAARRS